MHCFIIICIRWSFGMAAQLWTMKGKIKYWDNLLGCVISIRAKNNKPRKRSKLSLACQLFWILIYLESNFFSQRAIIHYVFLTWVFGFLHQFWVFWGFSWFQVFMFFLPSVEQIFFRGALSINFFCTFLHQEKTQKPENPKTWKPENPKTH